MRTTKSSLANNPHRRRDTNLSQAIDCTYLNPEPCTAHHWYHAIPLLAQIDIISARPKIPPSITLEAVAVLDIRKKKWEPRPRPGSNRRPNSRWCTHSGQRAQPTTCNET